MKLGPGHFDAGEFRVTDLDPRFIGRWLHAALAYALVPIPNLIWVVRDPAGHPAFDVLCWWALGISSPFFLMSGFFAAELYRTRGPRAFLVNRAERIVAPFLAAGFTILPATFFVWIAGWLMSGECTPREFFRMKFHAHGYQRKLFGPAHLWSLEYLAVMLGAFWMMMELRLILPWRWALPSICADHLGRWLVSRERLRDGSAAGHGRATEPRPARLPRHRCRPRPPGRLDEPSRLVPT